jgi:hypothetical protein
MINSRLTIGFWRRLAVIVIPLLLAMSIIFTAGNATAANNNFKIGGDATTYSTDANPKAKPCTAKDIGGGSFLYLPHWWEYMKTFQVDTLNQCQPVFDFPTSLLPIGLAILDILLRIAGFAAVVAIILCGIKYILAQGNSEQAASARRALFNALIGLGIAFAAAALVTFAGKYLAR